MTRPAIGLLESIKGKNDKDEWGPLVWEWIHSLCIMYPDSKPGANKIFRDNLYHVINNLPCKECIKHANAYIAEHPTPLGSIELQKWSFDFHNAVNRRLGKRIFTQREFEERYVKVFRTKQLVTRSIESEQ